jgi:hypothetical protein
VHAGEVAGELHPVYRLLNGLGTSVEPVTLDQLDTALTSPPADAVVIDLEEGKNPMALARLLAEKPREVRPGHVMFFSDDPSAVSSAKEIEGASVQVLLRPLAMYGLVNAVRRMRPVSAVA